MKTVQEVHKCPFCGSNDIEEIDRFTIHSQTSMYISEDRVDELGECTVFVVPVKQATKQQFRCNSCHSCFETRNYAEDVETYRRR